MVNSPFILGAEAGTLSKSRQEKKLGSFSHDPITFKPNYIDHEESAIHFNFMSFKMRLTTGFGKVSLQRCLQDRIDFGIVLPVDEEKAA